MVAAKLYLTFFMFAASSAFVQCLVYDLTHAYDQHTVYWPTERKYKFQLTNVDRFYDQNTNSYYEANRFSTAEHGGTHLDAPLHFKINGKDVSDIEAKDLMGDGFVVDVRHHALRDRDLLITTEHIKDSEKKHGKIPNKSILLLMTGWSTKWPDLNEYFGTNTTNTSILHFPGLHPDAAKWLIKNRKINAIGIDTASIDFGQSSSYGAHHVLLTAGIPILENVKDIYQIFQKQVTVFALPMKIKNGSGAPVRIVAVENYDLCKS